MKCYVYYQDETMPTFKPLDRNYNPTSSKIHATIVDSDDPKIIQWIDDCISDNVGVDGFISMQLRDRETGKVVYSKTTKTEKNESVVTPTYVESNTKAEYLNGKIVSYNGRTDDYWWHFNPSWSSSGVKYKVFAGKVGVRNSKPIATNARLENVYDIIADYLNSL